MTIPDSCRAALLVAWAAALGGGCSILLHVDADQCSSTEDCTARGGAFLGRVCVAGTCVLPEASSVDDAAVIDASPDATTSIDSGGLDAAPTEAEAAVAEAAGAEAAVDAGGPTCNASADCSQVSGATAMCNVDTHQCTVPKTAECPYLFGDVAAENMGLEPIFIGAFATLPPTDPTGHPSYLNFELAQEDFAGAGGIPAGTGSALRMPIVVVCDLAADVNVVMNHLVNEVGVRAVVAGLPPATLATTFSNVNLGGDASAPPVFFMNPFGADSTLTSLTTNYLLWHMLGQPSDVAPAYAAFFPRVEAYLRSTTALGPTTPMKVATVTSNSIDTNDLASAVKSVLTWNGGASSTATQLSDCDAGSTYCDVGLEHSTLDGYALADIDVTDAVTTLVAYRPDVVISFACDEFMTLIETLEIPTASNPSPPTPFYLIGPFNVDSPYLLDWLPSVVGPTVPDSKRERIAGINFASTPNNQVLSGYDTHFVSAFGSAAATDLGSENYYDAMYFTIYSLVAAGRPPALNGTQIGEGMSLLVNRLSPSTFSVGPTDIGNVISALHNNGTTGISLVGTLGPPDFNLTTGARINEGDVYCVQRNPPDAGTVNSNPPYYLYDVLRLGGDAGTASDGGTAGAGPLVGTFSCYTGM